MQSLLSTISSPRDLQKIPKNLLNPLADEIRERIIHVLSRTGGHLASNLGTIELTIALHYVFNSPQDKFLFDTSHQTYTHKMLTGRNAKLETIRQFHGLSGFADPKESEHDHFYAGHAGTSLSLALGLATSRAMTHSSEWIIPVLGDAAFTCGLTMEALNNIPENLSRFIIVLNDNAMSISKNVGAITTILSQLINSPRANNVYRELEDFLAKIPSWGKALAQSGHTLRESMKNLVSAAPFFEQYNLSYVGPIDGHDIHTLVDIFSKLKEAKGPILLHLRTTKGQGMPRAIENPTSYHGAKPFDPETGKFHPQPTQKPTFPKIFGAEMLALAAEDPNLITITPAMPAGSCLQPLMDAYPDRCIDVGIAEGHSVTYAGGIAKNPKLKVCLCIYATFAQRAFDNIYHDVCLQNLPVVFAFDRSGLAGGDGVTHNGIYDIAFLCTMPNMIVAQPRNGRLLRELVRSSFTWGAPAVIRYPNLPTEDTPCMQTRHPGNADILRQGRDIAIISLGHMADVALDLADHLEQRGYSPTVVDPIFVKPLDTKTLLPLLTEHTHLITIEEHAVSSGLGATLNTFIAHHDLGHLKVHNAGIDDVFVEQGKHHLLLEEVGLTAGHILADITARFELATEVFA